MRLLEVPWSMHAKQLAHHCTVSPRIGLLVQVHKSKSVKLVVLAVKQRHDREQVRSSCRDL